MSTHPFIRRCNLCELSGCYSVIGDGQYRCQVCGGVEFGIVRKKSLIRRCIAWWARPKVQGVLFEV